MLIADIFIYARYLLFVTVYWLQSKGGYEYSFMISYFNTSVVCELRPFILQDFLRVKNGPFLPLLFATSFLNFLA